MTLPEITDPDGDNTTLEFIAGFDESFMTYNDETRTFTFKDIKKIHEGVHSIEMKIRDTHGLSN